jgi:hypothetical protein
MAVVIHLSSVAIAPRKLGASCRVRLQLISVEVKSLSGKG